MRGETACVRTPNYVLTVGHALRRRSQFHTHDAECCNFCDLKTSSDSLFGFFLSLRLLPLVLTSSHLSSRRDRCERNKRRDTVISV